MVLNIWYIAITHLGIFFRLDLMSVPGAIGLDIGQGIVLKKEVQEDIADLGLGAVHMRDTIGGQDQGPGHAQDQGLKI